MYPKLHLELLLSTESSTRPFRHRSMFYPRFCFFARVKSAPLSRAYTPRLLAPLPRPPLAAFVEGGAEEAIKVFKDDTGAPNLLDLVHKVWR